MQFKVTCGVWLAITVHNVKIPHIKIMKTKLRLILMWDSDETSYQFLLEMVLDECSYLEFRLNRSIQLLWQLTKTHFRRLTLTSVPSNCCCIRNAFWIWWNLVSQYKTGCRSQRTLAILLDAPSQQPLSALCHQQSEDLDPGGVRHFCQFSHDQPSYVDWGLVS